MLLKNAKIRGILGIKDTCAKSLIREYMKKHGRNHRL
jgi:hypothetical protein